MSEEYQGARSFPTWRLRDLTARDPTGASNTSSDSDLATSLHTTVSCALSVPPRANLSIHTSPARPSDIYAARGILINPAHVLRRDVAVVPVVLASLRVDESAVRSSRRRAPAHVVTREKQQRSWVTRDTSSTRQADLTGSAGSRQPADSWLRGWHDVLSRAVSRTRRSAFDWVGPSRRVRERHRRTSETTDKAPERCSAGEQMRFPRRGSGLLPRNPRPRARKSSPIRFSRVHRANRRAVARETPECHDKSSLLSGERRLFIRSVREHPRD